MEHWRNTSLENLIQEVDGVTYMEEWESITNFPYYMVSSFGRIKSLPKLKVRSSGNFITKEKIIKQNIANTGYLFFSLCHTDGKIYTKHGHRLVAEAFIPNIHNKPEVNHKDGIKTKNMVHQLEWHTKSENRKHAYDMGLQNKDGENHHLSKLTDDKVLEIRYLKTMGIKGKEISKWYNISEQTISGIFKGRTWKHI